MPIASTVFFAMRLLHFRSGRDSSGQRFDGRRSSNITDTTLRRASKHSCRRSGHDLSSVADRKIETGAGFHRRASMVTTDNANQNLIVTSFSEVNSGEEGAVAALLKAFLPQAQREPGVKAFQIHQNVAKPREFFFYEVFAGEAAFADHQQTDHFKNIILSQAIPKLAKRERQQFRFI